MKNLTQRSTTRFAAVLLLATGVMTGALLTSGMLQDAPSAQLYVDPAIPALVVVGKRPAHDASGASGRGIVGLEIRTDAPSTSNGTSAQIATATGL